MIFIGQIALLCAFVTSGFAAFACSMGAYRHHRAMERWGLAAGLGSVVLLTSVVAILAHALVIKDFHFAYVAEYSDRLLPWHYSLSALWVGQAGSLLLWAWLLGVLAVIYRFAAVRRSDPLREPAFGVLMAYFGFLVAIMVFAADPMEPNLSPTRDGAGLSPLLQHPAMLLHPPIVFLGYAGWAIPSALAISVLLAGRGDAEWPRQSRPWLLFSWTVLGGGILLGADWAYEELGWGGYWGWDPVENGSLIPWLTGTALVHTALAWQYRGILKKTTLALAIATFALCNFATFLTRSGMFSSLHAFSRSPIGWMFLTLMVALSVAGAVLLVVRRRWLAGRQPLSGFWTRESLIVVSALALVLLAAVVTVGTLIAPLSGMFGRQIVLGPAFFNRAMVPVGLLLVAAVAAAPLCRWGRPVSASETRLLVGSLAIGGLAAVLAWALGIRHPIALTIAAFSTFAVAALAGTLLHDCTSQSLGAGLSTPPMDRPEVSRTPSILALRRPRVGGSGGVGRPAPSAGCAPNAEALKPWQRIGRLLTVRRRQYAGFLIHLGFIALAIGVTGTSLGTRQHEAVIREGETLSWAGWSIRFARLIQREEPDKLAVEAQLEVSRHGDRPFTLFPAQHYYRRQNDWTTEVAIHSAWAGDFYTILHGNDGPGRASFTFVENPLIRWMWLSAAIAGVGTLWSLWPQRRAAKAGPAKLRPGPGRRRARRRAVTTTSRA